MPKWCPALRPEPEDTQKKRQGSRLRSVSADAGKEDLPRVHIEARLRGNREYRPWVRQMDSYRQRHGPEMRCLLFRVLLSILSFVILEFLPASGTAADAGQMISMF